MLTARIGADGSIDYDHLPSEFNLTTYGRTMLDSVKPMYVAGMAAANNTSYSGPTGSVTVTNEIKGDIRWSGNTFIYDKQYTISSSSGISEVSTECATGYNCYIVSKSGLNTNNVTFKVRISVNVNSSTSLPNNTAARREQYKTEDPCAPKRRME